MRRRILLALAALTLTTVLLLSGCASVVRNEEPADEVTIESAAVNTQQDAAESQPMETQECAQAEFDMPLRDECDTGTTDYYMPYNSGSEEYGSYQENEYTSPMKEPFSTFSIDVDTASYSNIRRFLNDGGRPPEDAVRVEECINYFTYDYDPPMGSNPVSIGVTVSDCPWNEGRYLARIALQAQHLDLSEAPKSNIVFLIDVSGSMEDTDKLPLVKSALNMLADNLSDDDRISIVVYAGASGLVLDGCRGSDRVMIESALEQLSAGGSTAGSAGIALAYSVAEHYFIDGGNNRVILCTDGDFNVGPSSMEDLEDIIANKRETGIFLSVLGFGEGNIKDNKMETLADKGNGNYAYIDSLNEAKKVLVNELTSTLFTVAKDVKVQVEFNPEAVREYRLVGYDNRMLNPEDFNDDKKDAGEMGAGHCVTAFYEIILVNSNEESKDIDELVFQDNPPARVKAPENDWFYVKLRYKEPDGNKSKLMSVMAGAADYTYDPDEDYRFASAVCEFALLLKGSDNAGDADYERLIARARAAKGYDPDGYRAQFIQLAELAEMMGIR